jgi:hypothetical protein
MKRIVTQLADLLEQVALVPRWQRREDAQPQLRARLSRSIGSTKGSHVVLFTASKWRTRHRHQKNSCRGRAGLDEGLPFIGTEGDALVAEELFCVAGAEQRTTGIMCRPRGE